MSQEKKQAILRTTGIMCGLFVICVLTVVLGMMITLRQWNIFDEYVKIAALSVTVFILFAVFYVYLNYSSNSRSLESMSRMKLLAVSYVSMVIGILLSCAAGAYLGWYAVPLAFVSLIVGILVRVRVGVMATVITGMSVMIISPATELASDAATVMPVVLGCFTGMVSGFVMAFLIRRRYSRFKLTWGAIIVSLAMMPFSALISLLYTLDASTVLRNAIMTAIGNMLAVAVITATLPLYERVFNVWTDFRLQELITLRQPLLKKLNEDAPGTFSHSMAVANLAESCAVAIGINPYMARACGYFHDIGKSKNPQFFIENQKDGYNPHDELIPEVSVSMITRHTTAGYEMLKAAHMPEEICKAAIEHHGDSPVSYFYMKVKSITEGEVDDKEFCYEGPCPTTKYSAIIMICDICEAMFRAKPPEDMQTLEKSVDGVIKSRLTEGQLDDCGLTMHDLKLIKQTICRAIPASMHKRIDYDKAKERR